MVPAAGKQLFVSALRQQYIRYCLQENIDLPAAKNKMGQAIAKIHNKPEIRQQTHGRITRYYYHNYEVLDDTMRQGSDTEIHLPNYFTLSVTQPYIVFNVPTGLLYDNNPVNFLVLIDVNTSKVRLSVRGIEIDVDKIGIAPFAKYIDQAFVDGLELIVRAWVLCSGKTARLAVNMSSRIISRHAIGYIPGTGQALQTSIKWFSKNCKGVLPLTCELSNCTCRSCVHDVNARIDKDAEDPQNSVHVKKEKYDDDDNDDDDGNEEDDDDFGQNGSMVQDVSVNSADNSQYYDKSDTEDSNSVEIQEIAESSVSTATSSVSIINLFVFI